MGKYWYETWRLDVVKTTGDKATISSNYISAKHCFMEYNQMCTFCNWFMQCLFKPQVNLFLTAWTVCHNVIRVSNTRIEILLTWCATERVSYLIVLKWNKISLFNYKIVLMKLQEWNTQVITFLIWSWSLWELSTWPLSYIFIYIYENSYIWNTYIFCVYVCKIGECLERGKPRRKCCSHIL